MRISGRSYKASLLLLVFSLNTIVSFACSFGGVFHNFHHRNTATVEHQPSHGIKHTHGDDHKHDHGKKSAHKHGDHKPGDHKDNCCSDSVTELQKQDKSLSRHIEAPHLSFVVLYVHSVFELFSVQSIEKTSFINKIRWRPSTTIQDLRIVIQSFQI